MNNKLKTSGIKVKRGRVETTRHVAAEASGVEVLAVFLAAEVQREEGPLSIAAQRTAERLFT